MKTVYVVETSSFYCRMVMCKVEELPKTFRIIEETPIVGGHSHALYISKTKDHWFDTLDAAVAYLSERAQGLILRCEEQIKTYRSEVTKAEEVLEMVKKGKADTRAGL